jgi:Zn finger protein HypA/HybF involved in hydrogenase expression
MKKIIIILEHKRTICYCDKCNKKITKKEYKEYLCLCKSCKGQKGLHDF